MNQVEKHYVRVTKDFDPNFDWRAFNAKLADAAQRTNKQAKLLYLSFFFTDILEWMVETEADDRMRPIIADSDTTTHRPTFAFEFDDLSTATLFRLRFADDYTTQTGFDALFTRLDHKTLFTIKPDFVTPATGQPARLCAAIADEFRGAIAWHRDHNSRKGTRAPFVLACKHWLRARRSTALFNSDWNLFGVLLDIPQVKPFFEQFADYITCFHFLSDDYIEQAIRNYQACSGGVVLEKLNRGAALS